MADLISRAAAIDAIRETWQLVNRFAKPYDLTRVVECIKAIKQLPAVDAVPVVRCFECKYRLDSIQCSMYSEGMNTPDNWYCADGERRDGDT